jgi:hypothetical protein
MNEFDYELNARINETEASSKRRNARSTIDAQLREDHTGYTFSELIDRFSDGFSDANEDGDDHVTIKIPSGSEFSTRTAYVADALGRRMR